MTGEYADGGGSGCFESMDSGDTWQPIECGELPEEKDVFVKHQLDSNYANAIVADPNNPDILYAGTDGGFFISYDDGKKWAPVNDGLLDGLVIYDVAVDKYRNVYASRPWVSSNWSDNEQKPLFLRQSVSDPKNSTGVNVQFVKSQIVSSHLPLKAPRLSANAASARHPCSNILPIQKSPKA